MKKIKLLFDKLILNKLEKINPIFYRTIMFHLDKKYSEFVNSIKYKDKHFFNLVYLEISTYCNRKCSYCPNKYYDTPKEFMSWELIKHIVEELKLLNYSGAISYCLYNEPLFDNRLKEIVQYINKNLPNSIQLLVSNGDLLTLDNAKELLNSGINKFIITVHDENPSKNLNRLKPIKMLLKEKMILKTSSELYIQNRGGLIEVQEHKKFDYFQNKCQHINKLNITKDGYIILCCNDYLKKYVMGNIKEQSLKDIWNSYNNLRINILEKNIIELDICKKCLNVNNE